MATIKVYSAVGVKEIKCFQTLDDVDYLPVEEEVDAAPEDLEAAEENTP